MIQNDNVIYSAEQIRVPPELPDILKNYTKYILKNQPKDILAASSEYFANLSKNKSISNEKQIVSRNQVEALYLALSAKDTENVTKNQLYDACKTSGISEQIIKECLALGKWTTDVNYIKFWSLVVASTTTSLKQTMQYCADIIASGRPEVPLQQIKEIFEFLASRDNGASKASLETFQASISSIEGQTIATSQLNMLLEKSFQ